MNTTEHTAKRLHRINRLPPATVIIIRNTIFQMQMRSGSINTGRANLHTRIHSLPHRHVRPAHMTEYDLMPIVHPNTNLPRPSLVIPETSAPDDDNLATDRTVNWRPLRHPYINTRVPQLAKKIITIVIHTTRIRGGKSPWSMILRDGKVFPSPNRLNL